MQAVKEARVGPNAVTQLGAVLAAEGGAALKANVFAAAGLAAYTDHPPTQMIPQSEALALHRALYLALPRRAEDLAFAAGQKTADYLLANRIPRPAQALLKVMPKRIAARLFLKAIAANAWTFCGTGRFEAAMTPEGCEIRIGANPLAMNPCAWHCGVFTRLFRALISPRTHVVETACTGAGAEACVFAIRL